MEALLADPNAFRGNKMNQLKVAVDSLRGLIEGKVSESRAAVRSAIENKLASLLGEPIYTGATSQAQKSVTGRVDTVFASLDSERLVAVMEQTGAHFVATIYPALVDELAESANPSEPVKPSVALSTIKVPTGPGFIEDEADIDRYLVALRAALVETLNDGKRITL